MRKPVKVTDPPAKPPTRFVIDKKGNRVPVATDADIVDAAWKAKGGKPAEAGDAPETEEN